MKKSWTKEEIKILKDNINLPRKEIADLLDRSFQSIKNKIKELNLGKDKTYSREEDEFLIKNYSNMPKKDIAKKLNRSLFSIHNRAKKLKLNFYKEPKIGSKFGRLTLLKIIKKYDSKQNYNKRYGLFKCQCGNIIEILLTSVINKKVLSCKCYAKEIASQTIINLNKTQDHQLKCIQGKLDKYGTLNIGCIGPSKIELEIKDFLSKQNFIFNSNRTLLNGREIDLYNEKLKLGIEYCGLYWHNEHSPSPRTKMYHYNKYKKCLDQGVQLITIFEDEWKFRREQVESYLKSKLGVCDYRIYGRKCKVQEIDKTTGRDFIESYHIQGKRGSKNYFGLFYEDELVGCMSFSLHHRNNKSMTLDRLAFKSGRCVLGGASKLLKAAIPWVQSQGYDSIVSWSDNRWSTGNVYDKIGFKLDGKLSPDYSYVKTNNPTKRYSKQSMSKKALGCPAHKTELEYCHELGFSRIWDCGKNRYIYYI